MKQIHFSTEKELIDYSKKLENRSLNDILHEDLKTEAYTKGKGSLGQTVEKLFFGYEINSKKEADFKHVGRELKVAPLKKITINKKSEEPRKRVGLGSKERIVLTIIDYIKLAEETWENNSMVEKIRLLIMFYLHESDKNQLDYIFKLIELWEPSPADMKIIREDWETIQGKVLAGRAHYISEGDTLYLGACTKGTTSEKSYRKQPNSKELAKQRAFSLKSSYVNSIIDELLEKRQKKEKAEIPRKIALLTPLDRGIEDALNRKFNPYYGKSIIEVCNQLGIKISGAKNFYRIVINKILGGREDALISEIEKAGIKIKVIRLTSEGKIPEHIAFPNFSFIEVAETQWDDSELKEMLETTKYLFVVLKMDCKNSEFQKLTKTEKFEKLKLDKILLWNMPMEDIEDSARVMWEKTKDVIVNGIEINKVGKKRYNNFPNASDSETMHVRPHGKNALDTNPLPNGEEFTKQCFWFNKEYIEKVISNKQR